jgi:hypothetical protein
MADVLRKYAFSALSNEGFICGVLQVWKISRPRIALSVPRKKQEILFSFTPFTYGLFNSSF